MLNSDLRRQQHEDLATVRTRSRHENDTVIWSLESESLAVEFNEFFGSLLPVSQPRNGFKAVTSEYKFETTPEITVALDADDPKDWRVFERTELLRDDVFSIEPLFRKVQLTINARWHRIIILYGKFLFTK
jgi:hypothetical protein